MTPFLTSFSSRMNMMNMLLHSATISATRYSHSYKFIFYFIQLDFRFREKIVAECNNILILLENEVKKASYPYRKYIFIIELNTLCNNIIERFLQKFLYICIRYSSRFLLYFFLTTL